MDKEIVAIILARGGSKGLPNKNIRRIRGKHLIGYTIEAALASKYINKTVVSSDSPKILEIARQYGAQTIVRPPEFATDNASSEEAVRHAILRLQTKGDNYHLLILIQPTSPLRDSADINTAIELFEAKKAHSLISVYESEFNHFKTLVINNKGYLDGLINNKQIFMPRQEQPKVFIPNGAIYVIKVSKFLRHKTFLIDKTIHFLMPKEKSLDIDTLEDLKKIKKILKKNENSQY